MQGTTQLPATTIGGLRSHLFQSQVADRESTHQVTHLHDGLTVDSGTGPPTYLDIHLYHISHAIQLPDLTV
jgi:hypothetical protein